MGDCKLSAQYEWCMHVQFMRSILLKIISCRSSIPISRHITAGSAIIFTSIMNWCHLFWMHELEWKPMCICWLHMFPLTLHNNYLNNSNEVNLIIASILPATAHQHRMVVSAYFSNIIDNTTPMAIDYISINNTIRFYRYRWLISPTDDNISSMILFVSQWLLSLWSIWFVA